VEISSCKTSGPRRTTDFGATSERRLTTGTSDRLDQGVADTVVSAWTDEERALFLDLYRTMVRIRGFEDLVQALFLRGEIYGTTHLYSGQEAIAVGVSSVLGPDDRVAGTYRGHGHAMALGVGAQELLNELLGRAT